MDKALYLLPSLMSGLALLDMPYGYYQLLRLVVFICAGWLAWKSVERNRPGGMIVFGLVTLTFNPVFPLHFPRETWAILNIATALVFLAGWVLKMRRKQYSNNNINDVNSLPPQG